MLDSPTKLSHKFLIPNGAKHSNYGVVFAKLIVNKKIEGVHAFLVKLRDNQGEIMHNI